MLENNAEIIETEDQTNSNTRHNKTNRKSKHRNNNDVVSMVVATAVEVAVASVVSSAIVMASKAIADKIEERKCKKFKVIVEETERIISAGKNNNNHTKEEYN